MEHLIMSGVTEADVRSALREVTKSDTVDAWNVDFDFLQGAIDSLDHVTLALILEERHGIKITDDELPPLRTIAAIVEFAAKRTAA
jgi:acyl carrier protein